MAKVAPAVEDTWPLVKSLGLRLVHSMCHAAATGMLRESLGRRSPDSTEHLVNSVPPDSQNLRRPRLVALDPAQNAQQVALLQLLQRHKFFIIGSDALVGSTEDFRQILQVDNRPVGHNAGRADDIFQFPDIARPGMCRQPCLGAAGNPGNLLLIES